ncbi:MAG: FUSC family protein, partial [Gammaproteobacteria bacterium]
PAPAARFTFDRDRGTAAIRAVVTVCLAWLIFIYVNDLPNGTTLVMMSAPIGMALAAMPQLRVSQLFGPVSIGVLIGGVAHVFVMPHLSGFASLSLMIFGVTFAVCYLFAAPQQMLGRAFGLAMFVTIAGIDNDQSYSILGVLNTAVVFAMIFLLFSITAYVPVSPGPEKAFLRLLGRFFRSCDYLASLMGRDPHQPWRRGERWRRAFHTSELSALPGKLAIWAKFIDPGALPGTSAKQVQALVASLRTMTRCIEELLEERAHSQSKILAKALSKDVREWRLAVQAVLRQLSKNPAAVEQEVLRRKLAETMEHLEKRIIETLDSTPEGHISERDGEKFYRLLGSYRGVSDALVDYAGSAGAIEWRHWHEERFA